MSSVEETPVGDLNVLRQLLAEKQDECLRLRDDFNKYIQRSQRDVERRAIAEKDAFIHDLLPIVDDLKRALAADSNVASASLFQGVTISLQQLKHLLKQHHIEAVEDEDAVFDPYWHESVDVGCDPTKEDQTVLAVIRHGYRCGDKVFRPARVVVNNLKQSPGVNNGC